MVFVVWFGPALRLTVPMTPRLLSNLAVTDADNSGKLFTTLVPKCLGVFVGLSNSEAPGARLYPWKYYQIKGK